MKLLPSRSAARQFGDIYDVIAQSGQRLKPPLDGTSFPAVMVFAEGDGTVGQHDTDHVRIDSWVAVGERQPAHELPLRFLPNPLPGEQRPPRTGSIGTVFAERSKIVAASSIACRASSNSRSFMCIQPRPSRSVPASAVSPYPASCKTPDRFRQFSGSFSPFAFGLQKRRDPSAHCGSILGTVDPNQLHPRQYFPRSAGLPPCKSNARKKLKRSQQRGVVRRAGAFQNANRALGNRLPFEPAPNHKETGHVGQDQAGTYRIESLSVSARFERALGFRTSAICSASQDLSFSLLQSVITAGQPTARTSVECAISAITEDKTRDRNHIEFSLSW